MNAIGWTLRATANHAQSPFETGYAQARTFFRTFSEFSAGDFQSRAVDDVRGSAWIPAMVVVGNAPD